MDHILTVFLYTSLGFNSLLSINFFVIIGKDFHPKIFFITGNHDLRNPIGVVGRAETEIKQIGVCNKSGNYVGTKHLFVFIAPPAWRDEWQKKTT